MIETLDLHSFKDKQSYFFFSYLDFSNYIQIQESYG